MFGHLTVLPYQGKSEHTNNFSLVLFCFADVLCGVRVGHALFSKECNVLAFFCVLYKRTRLSLRSFALFIKERGVLYVLLLSL